MGCSGIARRPEILAIRAPETGVVAAIASRSLDKAKVTTEAFAIPKIYGSYEELLTDDSIDAVSYSIAQPFI